MKMTLSEIAQAVGAMIPENQLNQFQQTMITNVAIDSRHAELGSLFVPLQGTRDGHDFVANAQATGAVATFWQTSHPNRPTNLLVVDVDDPLVALQGLAKYYLMKVNPKVIAVTGSNGKTTTKDMIAAILATQNRTAKTQGNHNNGIGVPLTILEMATNTEVLVVEMGMDRPGQLTFLSKMVEPDVAVITMIGEAHIEFFGTRDKIADAKMEITHGLSDDGALVYNGDEPLLRDRVTDLTQSQVTFGQGEDNDLFATNVAGTSTATTFTTNEWPDTTFTIPMIGTYNVNNALAALAVAKVYRIRPENAQKGLANVTLTENRAEWLKGSNGEDILSDVYNSNPTAVKQVLAAFSKTPVTGRRVVVLGDMLELGDQSDAMHAGLAAAVDPQAISHVYLVGPHMVALQEQLAQRYPNLAVTHFAADDLASLSKHLQGSLTAADQILLKGSHGIHLEQVLAALQDPVQE